MYMHIFKMIFSQLWSSTYSLVFVLCSPRRKSRLSFNSVRRTSGLWEERLSDSENMAEELNPEKPAGVSETLSSEKTNQDSRCRMEKPRWHGAGDPPQPHLDPPTPLHTDQAAAAESEWAGGHRTETVCVRERGSGAEEASGSRQEEVPRLHGSPGEQRGRLPDGHGWGQQSFYPTS